MTELRRTLEIRWPVLVEQLPWMARPMAKAGPGHQRGLPRLVQRFWRAAFRYWHLRFRRPGRVILALWREEKAQRVEGDGRNTVFLSLRQHENIGGYEPEVAAIFQLLAPHLRQVFDVGANWGYYGLFFALHPGFRGRVACFEADPDTAAQQAHIIAQSGLGDVISSFHFALSDRDGTLALQRSRHSTLTQLADRAEASADEAETPIAHTRRLDSLLDGSEGEAALEPPDLIKIDVEGHEKQVLAGATRTLASRTPIIVLESGYRDGQPEIVLPPLEALSGAGYCLFQLDWQCTGRPPEKGRLTRGTLSLHRFETVEERLATARDLNILAWPERRLAELEALLKDDEADPDGR